MRNGQKGGGGGTPRTPRKRPALEGIDDPEIATALDGDGPGGDAAFQDFIEDFSSDPQKPLKFLRSYLAGEEAYNPAVDVIESKDCLTIIADLPGVVETDLRVEFVEGGVVLRGRREGATTGPGSRLRRAERPGGDFSKSVPLPHDLDLKNVSHKLESGVLTIVLPRTASKSDGRAVDPKQIKAAK